jgi:hypothetical protein
VALDQFGIHEEDWNSTPGSVNAALMFLLRQNLSPWNLLCKSFQALYTERV